MPCSTDSDMSSTSPKQMQYKLKQSNAHLHDKEKQNVNTSTKQTKAVKTHKSHKAQDTSDESGDENTFSHLGKNKESLTCFKNPSIKTEPVSSSLDSESDSSESNDEGNNNIRKNKKNISKEKITNSVHNLKKIQSKNNDSNYEVRQEKLKKVNRRKSTDSNASFANVMSSTKILKAESFNHDSDSNNELNNNFSGRCKPVLQRRASQISMKTPKTEMNLSHSNSSDSSGTENKTVIFKKTKQESSKNIQRSSLEKRRGSDSSSDDVAEKTLKNMKSDSDLARGTVSVKKKSKSDSDSSSKEDSKTASVTRHIGSKGVMQLKMNNKKHRKDISNSKSSSSDEDSTPNIKQLKDTKLGVKKEQHASTPDSSDDELRRENVKHLSNSKISMKKRMIKVKEEASNSSSESEPKPSSFISQKKLGHDNFAQNILKQTASMYTSDESDSERERKETIPLTEKNQQKKIANANESKYNSNLDVKLSTKLENSYKFTDLPPNVKVVDVSTSFRLDDITEEEEVWLMQCPKDLNPELLVGQKLVLDEDSKRSLKLGTNKYECVLKHSKASSICLVASQSATTNNLALKIVEPVGSIVIHEKLGGESPEEMVSPERTKIEPPQNLKVRHPIFGSNFKEKLKLGNSVKEKLKDAELNCSRVEEKMKKRKKAKIKQENDEGTDEMIFELLSQAKDNFKLSAEDNMNLDDLINQNKIKVEKGSDVESLKSKSKNKKKISVDQNLGNCRETMIEDLLRSTKADLDIGKEDTNNLKTRKHKKMKQESDYSTVNIKKEHETDAETNNEVSQQIETEHKKKKKKNKEHNSIKTEESSHEETAFPDRSKKNKKKRKATDDTTKSLIEREEISKIDSIFSNTNEEVAEDTCQRKKKKFKSKYKPTDDFIKCENIKEEKLSEDNNKDEDSLFMKQDDEIVPKKKHKKSHKSDKPSEDDYTIVESQANIYSDSNRQGSGEEYVSRKHKKHKIKSEDVLDETIIKFEETLSNNEDKAVPLKKKHKKHKHVEQTNDSHLEQLAVDDLLTTTTPKKKKHKEKQPNISDSEHHIKKKKHKF